MPSIPPHFTKAQAEQRRASNRKTMRKWRLKNLEKAKDRNRDYRVNHRKAWVESYRKAGAKYRAKDPEKYRDMQRKRESKPAAVARRKRYTKEHYSDSQIRVARWKTFNPERDRALTKNEKARRRARLLENGGVFDCSDKIQLLNQERFCHWCCVALTEENRSIDHVVPIARGGRHHPDNLVAACKPCNCSKGKKLISEWTWKEAA